jgi:hypothetical protein
MDADNPSPKEYEVLGVIGSGSFGLIRKVIRKRDNMVFPPYFLFQTDRRGFGSEGDSLLENVGKGETTTDTRSEYPVWITTSEYRAVLFTRDFQRRGHGLFIHGVLS